MRSTTKHVVENPLAVDLDGLMTMLSCGAVTAKKIADCAEAKIVMGRRVLYNVRKVSDYLDSIAV